MHFNILNEDQQKLLPLLSKFKREYFMVGGTSIALHIGHRMSIDFDLFKNGTIKPKAITKKIQDYATPQKPYRWLRYNFNNKTCKK